MMNPSSSSTHNESSSETIHSGWGPYIRSFFANTPERDSDPRSQTDEKIVQLDPFGLICRLALFNYLPVGTKPGLRGNSFNIYVKDPVGTGWVSLGGLISWQGAQRQTAGESSNDLAYLRPNLEIAVLALDETRRTHQDFEKIWKLAILGIDKLRQTYGAEKYRAIRTTLQGCQDIMRSALISGDSLRGRIFSNPAIIANSQHVSLCSPWTNDQQKLVLQLFAELAKAVEEEQLDRDGTLWSIHHYCLGKDSYFADFDTSKLQPHWLVVSELDASDEVIDLDTRGVGYSNPSTTDAGPTTPFFLGDEAAPEARNVDYQQLHELLNPSEPSFSQHAAPWQGDISGFHTSYTASTQGGLLARPEHDKTD
jgi:hypothetical protein